MLVIEIQLKKSVSVSYLSDKYKDTADGDVKFA